MKTWQALLGTQCWYLGCDLDGVLIGAGFTSGGAMMVRVCAFHAAYVSQAVLDRDLEVAVLTNALGLPVIVIHGAVT